MAILTYEKYMDLIPEETKEFIKILFSYLYYTDRIEFSRFNIVDNTDKLFYKSLKAYGETNESNKITLQVLGFDYDNYLNRNNPSTETQTRLFTEYYQALAPFENEEEYLTLTPEDIIKNIHDNLMKKEKEYRTYILISSSDDKFVKKLYEMSLSRKEEMINKLSKNFNKSYSISVINFYNMTGKIYLYLRDNKDKLKNINTATKDLKNIAMLIAIYYYNHVSVYKDAFNEQQIIIDYFNSKGLTIEQIEKAIGIEIKKEDLSKYDPTNILSKEFTNMRPTDIDRNSLSVGALVSSLINNGYFESLAIKHLLGACNLTISGVSKLNEVIKQQKEELSNTSIEDLYKGLMPNVISYLKRLSSIYTYLLTKENTLDKNLITNHRDLYVLATLISSYEFKSKYNDFFTEKGLTIEEVLKLVKLPEKDTLYKELATIEPNEREIAKFASLIVKGVNYEKPKENITVNSILDNTKDKNRTKSSLLQKLFTTITKEKLDDDFTNQMKDYFNKKEDKRKRELTESLLENIPINVFNFLKILCSYFIILNKKGLDTKDQEQLAIIFAASRFDKRIEKYLDSLGMTRNALSKAIKVDFSYEDKKFDIDIIKDNFYPYIFNRPNEEITVYSIFENAFDPKLTNTLNLRKVLYTFSKTPEDFMGIENSLITFEQKQKELAMSEEQEKLINRCDEKSRTIIEDALLIHDYLKENLKNNELIQTEDDLEEISLLIALFVNDQEYVPFFIHNGVTLDEILSKVDLNIKTLEDIRKMTINKKTIFAFKKYLNNSSTTIKTIIAALLDEKINSSQVLERITSETGNNYSYLVEEVSEQKERELTPVQGMEILAKEEVEPIESTSLSTIVDYGTSISKHSKYINDALHEIIFADTLDHSLDEINELLGEVSYEEQLPGEKQSFFERLFGPVETPKVIKKYNPTKIGDLQTQVEEQISILSKELKGYEFIKKYIETYLRKLNEYLTYLKKYYNTLSFDPIDDELDEITKFTRTLDQNSSRKILEDKIMTFETMILLMKQELITVHRSIINHFITINSLQTSKSAIIPLIATEIAVNMGKETESEALELTSDLINLLGSVVNKNSEATKLNLEKLKLTSISKETYDSMSREINLYLESLNRGNEILEKTEKSIQPLEDKPRLKL